MQGQRAGAVLEMNTGAQMEFQQHHSNIASSTRLRGRADKQWVEGAVGDGTEIEDHVSPVALESRELMRTEPLYVER